MFRIVGLCLRKTGRIKSSGSKIRKFSGPRGARGIQHRLNLKSLGSSGGHWRGGLQYTTYSPQYNKQSNIPSPIIELISGANVRYCLKVV